MAGMMITPMVFLHRLICHVDRQQMMSQVLTCSLCSVSEACMQGFVGPVVVL